MKRYLLITKPGIIFGNLIAVIGGFFLASKGHFDLAKLFAVMVGTSLVVASGCVFNNYVDRDIDCMMERTRNRVMARGLISPPIALAYASLLGLGGVLILHFFTNDLALAFAIMGFIVYVGFYTLYFKRNSEYGTIIGSLSGAAPPVIGYCAASGHFDLGAALLLLIFCLWQMPHSYAIAIFRFNDYKAADIPVLPVKRGITIAKRHIVGYIVAFTAAAISLYICDYAGIGFLIVTGLIGCYWLLVAIKDYSKANEIQWAKRLFIISILAITLLSVMTTFEVNWIQ